MRDRHRIRNAMDLVARRRDFGLVRRAYDFPGWRGVGFYDERRFKLSKDSHHEPSILDAVARCSLAGRWVGSRGWLLRRITIPALSKRLLRPIGRLLCSRLLCSEDPDGERHCLVYRTVPML